MVKQLVSLRLYLTNFSSSGARSWLFALKDRRYLLSHLFCLWHAANRAAVAILSTSRRQLEELFMAQKRRTLTSLTYGDRTRRAAL